MPDPILTLADLKSPSPFRIGGVNGSVFPQFLDAGSKRHHSRWFYVEFPADDSGSFYQIDASTLVSIIGDGGTRRHFTPDDVSSILANISPRLDHPAFLRSIAVKS